MSIISPIFNANNLKLLSLALNKIASAAGEGRDDKDITSSEAQNENSQAENLAQDPNSTENTEETSEAPEQEAAPAAEPEAAPEEEKKTGFFWELNDMASGFLGHDLINKLLGAGDIASAATDVFRIPAVKAALGKTFLAKILPWKHIKHFIDDWSVKLTKGAIMARYINAGLGAFLNKRIVEAVGRVAGTMALPFVKLEDITLATGLTTFFSQTDLGLEQQIGAKKKKTYGSMLENAREWFGTWLKLGSEIFEKGFAGADRNLFPDFSWKQITDLPKRFKEDYFSGKDIIGIPGEKERGHTAVFGAYFIGAGALIGFLFGRQSRNIWNKLGGVIRNFGGILGDYTLLTHTDPKMRRAGYFFGAATVIDAVQRFLPTWMINTINHLNCLNNLIAQGYYAGRSKDRTDGNIHVYGDADADERNKEAAQKFFTTPSVAKEA